MKQKETAKITWDDYCFISNAVNYDQVTSVSAAYSRLLKFRNDLLEMGKIIIYTKSETKEIADVTDYDEWVRKTFPVFLDDPLHPMFRKP